MASDLPPAMPMAASDYRRVQAVMPGIESLYRCVRAICDARLASGADILIVGAGGGREIEALVASPKAYRLTGIDPSADMLAVAREYVASAAANDRVTLVQGVTADLPAQPAFDAATSILVMHFLPDDGSKQAYLREIRTRLTRGATYLHTDICFECREQFDALADAMREHAGLAGLGEIADAPPAAIEKLAFGREPSAIAGEARALALFEECGFKLIAPFYRGFWYAGWWLEAA